MKKKFRLPRKLKKSLSKPGLWMNVETKCTIQPPYWSQENYDFYKKNRNKVAPLSVVVRLLFS